jgi:hypothetical protein
LLKITSSSTLNEEARRHTPYSEQAEPNLLIERRDNDEPKWARSRTEKLLARRAIPNKDKEEPNLANERIDKVLPWDAKSNIENEEPNKPTP